MKIKIATIEIEITIDVDKEQDPPKPIIMEKPVVRWYADLVKDMGIEGLPVGEADSLVAARMKVSERTIRRWRFRGEVVDNSPKAS